MTTAWETVAPLPMPLISPAVVSWQGKLYVFGASNHARRLFVYNPNNNTWSERKKMPNPGFYNVFAATGANKLIVAGGINASTGKVSKYTWRYRDKQDDWVKMRNMPSPRHTNGASVACGLRGKLYVVGGMARPSGSVRSETYAYDIRRNRWTQRRSLTKARVGHAIGHRQGKLYVVGGVEDGVAASTSRYYDPKKNRWTLLEALPIKSNPTRAAFGGGKILTAGSGANDTEVKSTYIYSYADDAWSIADTSGHDGRKYAGGARLGGYFYMVGGTDSNGNALESVMRLNMPDTEDRDFESGQLWPRCEDQDEIGHWEYVQSDIYDPGLDDPVLYWRMNEASGSTTVLNYGNAAALYNATVQPGSNAANMKLGEPGDSAVPFATTSLRIDNASGSTINRIFTPFDRVDQSFTVEGLVKAGFASASGQNPLHVFSTYSNAKAVGGIRLYVDMSSTGGGKLKASYENGAGYLESSGSITGGWHHVAYVRDAVAKTVKLFLDGKLIASASNVTTAVTVPSVATVGNNSNLANTTGSSGAYGSGTGYIERVAYFSSALSDATINSHSMGWKIAATNYTPRIRVARAVLDGYLYVAGGMSTGSLSSGTNELTRIDLNTLEVKKMANIPVSNGAGMLGAWKGKLYYVGGYGASYTTLYVYDVASNSWSTKTAMPTYRDAAGYGVINGKFYIAGGDVYYGSNNPATLYIYDIDTDKWSTGAALPIGGQAYGSAVIGGKLYLCGGTQPSGAETDFFARYDPASNTWETLPPLPVKGYFPTALVDKGKFYAIAPSVNTNIYCFDPSTNAWTIDTEHEFPGTSGPGGGGAAAIRPDGSWLLAIGSTNVTYPLVTFEKNMFDPEVSDEAWVPDGLEGQIWPRQSPDVEVGHFEDLPATADGTYGTGWTSLASIPDPNGREHFAFGEIDGKIYSAGGDGNVAETAQTAVTYCYDPSNNTWTAKAPIPGSGTDSHFNFGAFGVINGKLYVAGGGGGGTTTLNVYDPSTDSWTAKAPMPVTRSNGPIGSTVLGDKLYAVGGYVSSNWSNRVDVYDPATDTWSQVANLPAALIDTAPAVIDGKLYIAGGNISGSMTRVNTLYCYDPTTNVWTTKAPMPKTLQMSTGVVVDGKFLVIGGSENTTDPSFSGVLRYDPKTDAWDTSVPAMPSIRAKAGASRIGQVLYVYGGAQTSSIMYQTMIALGVPGDLEYNQGQVWVPDGKGGMIWP